MEILSPPARAAYVSHPADRAVTTAPGVRIEQVVPPEATDGAWAFYESTVEAGGGAPYHVHRRTTELVVVREGALHVLLDGAPVTLGPGATLVVPPGVAHGFYNPGPAPARVFAGASPGSHLRFLEALADVMRTTAPDGAERAARLADLYARHDQEPVAYPLPT